MPGFNYEPRAPKPGEIITAAFLQAPGRAEGNPEATAAAAICADTLPGGDTGRIK